MLEELDAPTEWHFDSATATLYYAPNRTASDGKRGADDAPPPLEGFVATTLQVLINASGRIDEPLHSVTFDGLGFVDTAHTLLAPHGLPSGGDWALPRLAALTLQATRGLTVTGCTFARLDGSAILANGYHRRLSLLSNEFVHLGGSAVVLWGDTSPCLNAKCSRRLPDAADGTPMAMGPDGRGGKQPIGTRLKGNLAHEIGLLQKQSAFLFQAVAAQTVRDASAHGQHMYNVLTACACEMAIVAMGMRFLRRARYCTQSPLEHHKWPDRAA